MAVNLALKYSSKIAEAFSAGSFVSGKTNKGYDITGVKTLKVYTPITVSEADYTRTGTSRYGTPTEMQDVVQELTMSQDKSFTLIIDKGNNSDQELVKRAGDMLKLQINEQSTPAADKYALAKFANMAGKVYGIGLKPTKDTIIATIADAVVALDDACVPEYDRYLYVTSEMYKFIRLSPEFTGLETLGAAALGKGVVGEIMGLKIVKVPTSYLPASCYFVIAYKNSVIMPYKISDAKVHKDPVGVSGAVIEGRHYYDAFVLGAKANGVYSCVLTSEKVATPTVTKGATTEIASATVGATIKYTTDKTDPRFSDSAVIYTGVIANPAADVVIKAYAYKTDKFTSDVLTHTCV